tara:strand:+ start:988 stop:1434 length:447 start_codon:yes stop_codon:yes gene_type:complete
MKVNKKIFAKDSYGTISNVAQSVGYACNGEDIITYDRFGWSKMWLKDDISDEVKASVVKAINDSLRNQDTFTLACGGKVPLQIIGDAYISPKSGNLIITSIAPDTALCIVKAEDFPEMDSLLKEVQTVLMDLSIDKVAAVEWDAYRNA